MKNILKMFGIIALVAIIGFSLISCEDLFGDKDKVPEEVDDSPIPVKTFSTTNLDGIWYRNNTYEIVTITGSTGVFTSVSYTSGLSKSAVDKGYIKAGETLRYQSLENTSGLNWAGQARHITYNTSAPDVATGLTWSNITLALDEKGQSLTINGADSKGAYTYTIYRSEIMPPIDLVTTGSTASSISLSWSSIAAKYYVYRSSSATGTYSKIANVSSTTYTDNGLSKNTTYYYKVAAQYSDGTAGPQSDYVFATTQADATNYITLSGTPKVGSTLTVTSSGTGWSSTTYLWGYAGSADANSYSVFSTTAGSTYTITSDYVGQYIRVGRLHPNGNWNYNSTNPCYVSNFIGPIQK